MRIAVMARRCDAQHERVSGATFDERAEERQHVGLDGHDTRAACPHSGRFGNPR
jgi:hypothetical protein